MAEESDPQGKNRAAIASFTLFVLQSRDITATIERCTSVVTQTMSAPMGALVQLSGPGRMTVVHTQGPIGWDLGDTFDVDAGLPTTAVSREPLAVDDRCPANGSPRSNVAREGDARATVSVSVIVEGMPWGRLLVSDTEPRQFSHADVEFLQAIAAVLAAALGFERLESGQAALAAFGRFALDCPDVSATIERAVDVVTRVLEAPLGAAIRVAPQPGTLTMVQVSGPVGFNVGDEYEVDPQLIEALLAPEPLIVEDWRTDDRFTTPLLPRPAQSLASIAAAVSVGERIWGSLVVSDTRPRHFSDTEINAMSTAADLLGAALRRKRAEWAEAGAARLSSTRDQKPTLLATEVALVNLAGVIVWVNRAWEEFCRDNGGDPARTGVGMSYLACCDSADDPLAEQVAAALRAALSGDLPAPMTVLIPCHSPHMERWFDVLISSRLNDAGDCLGAAVTLSPALP